MEWSSIFLYRSICGSTGCGMSEWVSGGISVYTNPILFHRLLMASENSPIDRMAS
jgi:hypothetical protein